MPKYPRKPRVDEIEKSGKQEMDGDPSSDEHEFYIDLTEKTADKSDPWIVPLEQPRPQGLLWFGARRVTKTLATIRNLIGQHLTLHSALPEYEFSLEGARSAKFLLLKIFQNVLSH